MKIRYEAQLDGRCPHSGRLEHIDAVYDVFKSLGSSRNSVIIRSVSGCSKDCPDCSKCPIVLSEA